MCVLASYLAVSLSVLCPWDVACCDTFVSSAISDPTLQDPGNVSGGSSAPGVQKLSIRVVRVPVAPVSCWREGSPIRKPSPDNLQPVLVENQSLTRDPHWTEPPAAGRVCDPTRTYRGGGTTHSLRKQSCGFLHAKKSWSPISCEVSRWA